MPKKILAILATARTGGNTSALLEHCAKGAEEMGAQVEVLPTAPQKLRLSWLRFLPQQSRPLHTKRRYAAPLSEIAGGRCCCAGLPGILRQLYRPAQGVYRQALLPDGKAAKEMCAAAHRRAAGPGRTARAPSLPIKLRPNT